MLHDGAGVGALVLPALGWASSLQTGRCNWACLRSIVTIVLAVVVLVGGHDPQPRGTAPFHHGGFSTFVIAWLRLHEKRAAGLEAWEPTAGNPGDMSICSCVLTIARIVLCAYTPLLLHEAGAVAEPGGGDGSPTRYAGADALARTHARSDVA